MVGLIVVLLVLALVLGGVGALVEGLFWLLFIGLALLVGGVVLGVMNRSRRGSVR